MTTYQPATLHSVSIGRPHCSKCGTKMRLFGIEPERPGYELHSFECPKCRYVEVKAGKSA
jgi:hypothetical protein